jgi:hypothetical protein
MWVREIIATLLVIAVLLAIFGLLIILYGHSPSENVEAAVPSLGLRDSN